jgi:hypothetical protein
MDPRDERIAKNEAVFRAANREIAQADKEAGGDGALEVLCECGQEERRATYFVVDKFGEAEEIAEASE